MNNTQKSCITVLFVCDAIISIALFVICLITYGRYIPNAIFIFLMFKMLICCVIVLFMILDACTESNAGSSVLIPLFYGIVSAIMVSCVFVMLILNVLPDYLSEHPIAFGAILYHGIVASMYMISLASRKCRRRGNAEEARPLVVAAADAPPLYFGA